MPLVIRNSRELINPDKYKAKILIFGVSGVGKTEWASDAPNPGVAACETGEGNGLLTAARKGVDYIEPETYQDFEAFCNGQYFKDKDSLILDSLSTSNTKFIVPQAISLAPRKSGDSGKRGIGLPELDDYKTMGELMRKNVNKLLDIDKHIICTALLKIKEPNMETGQGEYIVGPDLPGAMMLASPAMFDVVMCLKTESKLADPRDAKSRYTERYWVTASDGKGLIAKSRNITAGGTPILPARITWDIKTGEGSFPDILNRIKQAYREFNEKEKAIEVKG